MTVEPINTLTGNYVFQRNDLAIPGRGLPLVFTRTYNSLDTYSGPLGPGWTHSYNILLSVGSGGVVAIKYGDGHKEFYTPTGSGAFTSQFPGVFNTLVVNSDGTYTLTTKRQIRHQFSATGKLSRTADRNGNQLSFASDSLGNLSTITDTVGRTITLSYKGANQITTLTDPDRANGALRLRRDRQPR